MNIPREGRPAGGEVNILRRLLGFARLLRGNGFAVGLDEAMDAARALGAIDLARQPEVRAALRVLFCSCPADWRRFDELFDFHWLGLGVRRDRPSAGGMAAKALAPPTALGAPKGTEAADADTDSSDTGAGRPRGASRAEALAAADLRHVNDPAELARLHELCERWAARLRYRLSRRQRVHARGARLDLRRTIHRSLPYGGTPMRLAFRRRRPRPLRLVLVLDASGSMSLYGAFFLRFLRAVIANFRDADAFAFHTRLVPIGAALRERSVDKAIDKLALIGSGWFGGTRIGESLRAFNRHYAARTLNRRTVAMIMSDGYDTGPPALLAAELAAIRRRARRLIWLNPMMGWRGYEPVAAGMAAALPHLDLCAPAHNLESLMRIEPYLARV